jgi:hypothetical protein
MSANAGDRRRGFEVLSVRRKVDGMLGSALELFTRRRANMVSEGKDIVMTLYRSCEAWCCGKKAGQTSLSIDRGEGCRTKKEGWIRCCYR